MMIENRPQVTLGLQSELDTCCRRQLFDEILSEQIAESEEVQWTAAEKRLVKATNSRCIM